MSTFLFTKAAAKQFYKLDISAQQRIQSKLQELKKSKNINTNIKLLINFKPATHRLRIGNYRLILKDEKDGNFLVLEVGHRKDIYR